MRALSGLVAVLAVCLASCGGGGGADSSPTPPPVVTPAMVTISGIVSDEAVAGATVTVTAVDTAQALGTATTGIDGAFSVTVPAAQLGRGYLLKSSGGTMNGAEFQDSLTALYPAAAASGKSNLTLITTALVSAATSTTRFVGTLLDKHEQVKADAMGRGLFGDDYAAVEPAGLTMELLRGDASRIGVAGSTEAFADRIARGSVATPCIGTLQQSCSFDVDASGRGATLTVAGSTVVVPDGLFKQCRVTVIPDDADGRQSLTVQIEEIPDGKRVFVPRCAMPGSGKLELALGAPARLPGSCLLPPQKPVTPPIGGEYAATAISNCVTEKAGIAPTFLARSGLGFHRVGSPAFKVQLPACVVGCSFGPISIQRRFGAFLSASVPAPASEEWKDKTPVILVHGYSAGGTAGGDDRTWGNLAEFVANDGNKVALNFQWVTDASYLTVAEELAKAVRYASAKTGRKVHIVAHSFGGVLARVMLQNIGSSASIADAGALVETLTTVGTPHSGIVNEAAGLKVIEGGRTVMLPQGWGSLSLSSGLCMQVSCYESGLDAGAIAWAVDLLPKVNGLAPPRGYVAARLASLAQTEFPLPTGLKVQSLIGQIILESPMGRVFDNFDGLIAYSGQRFKPDLLKEGDLLTGKNPTGGAIVQERVLGLNENISAIPGTLVGTKALSDFASTGRLPSQACGNALLPVPGCYYGYKHSGFFGTLFTGSYAALVRNSEVNISKRLQRRYWLHARHMAAGQQFYGSKQGVMRRGKTTCRRCLRGSDHQFDLSAGGNRWWVRDDSRRRGEFTVVGNAQHRIRAMRYPDWGISRCVPDHMQFQRYPWKSHSRCVRRRCTASHRCDTEHHSECGARADSLLGRLLGVIS